MTRSGSMVYYLAAVVCGCLFMSAALVVAGDASLRNPAGGGGELLLLYFLSMVNGWCAALVFAFLLRRTASLAGWLRGWQWALAGAVLSPVVVWVMATLWTHALLGRIPLSWPRLLLAMNAIFLGPMTALTLPGSIARALLAAAAAGAPTALVLFAIHRSFQPRSD